MRDKIMDIMPEMKTGKELLDCLRETPEYPACIWEKNSMERLVALSDIYNVYIPSRMSVEIYHKLYMGLLRSTQKKESMQAVFDAYSAEPVGYILKPVSRQKLAEALTRAIRHLIPKSIIIDTPSRTVSFHIRDITYIEIINKELQIHLQDGTVTKIYKSLSAVREILPKDIFVQCHRCYIVSLYAVRSIRRFEITLNNHEIIPVSKYSYRDVQEQLQQYAAKWF